MNSDRQTAGGPGLSPQLVVPEVVITTDSSEVLPVKTFGQLLAVQPLAGHFSLPGPFPPGMKLVLAVPFVPGPATRLVLYYEWKLEPDQSCRVVLGAWPRADQPDFSRGIGKSKPYAANEHKAAGTEESPDLLEIVLTEDRDELWVAAVWIEAADDSPAINSYYLAAMVDVPESDAI